MSMWREIMEKTLSFFRKAVMRFAWDGRGATTAEYALLLTLVVIILISTLQQLGAELNNQLLEIIEQLRNAGG